MQISESLEAKEEEESPRKVERAKKAKTMRIKKVSDKKDRPKAKLKPAKSQGFFHTTRSFFNSSEDATNSSAIDDSIIDYANFDKAQLRKLKEELEVKTLRNKRAHS